MFYCQIFLIRPQKSVLSTVCLPSEGQNVLHHRNRDLFNIASFPQHEDTPITISRHHVFKPRHLFHPHPAAKVAWWYFQVLCFGSGAFLFAPAKDFPSYNPQCCVTGGLRGWTGVYSLLTDPICRRTIPLRVIPGCSSYSAVLTWPQGRLQFILFFFFKWIVQLLHLEGTRPWNKLNYPQPNTFTLKTGSCITDSHFLSS